MEAISWGALDNLQPVGLFRQPIALFLFLSSVTTPSYGQGNIFSGGGGGDIYWQMVLISVATSVITTLATLGGAYLIQKYGLFKKRRADDSESELDNVDGPRSSMRSTNTRITTISNGSSRSGVGPNVAYKAVPQNEKYLRSISQTVETGPHRTSRIKSDFISNWCTQNNLTEATAEILRQNGFTYKEAVESIRSDDVPALCLPRAQECLLREIVASKGRQFHQPKKSTSSEDIARSPTGSGTGGILDKSQSMTKLPEEPMQGNLKKKASLGQSVDSVDIIEDDHTGDRTIIIRGISQVDSQGTQNRVRKSNPKGFNGLLSDKGLYDLAHMIGVEWPHLATQLDIPSSIQDHIKMNFPSDALRQIFEMLKLWRDTATGTKEQVKGMLYKALKKCKRNDLADELLSEQVDGSKEKVAYHSIV